jgi:WD40 repeat protein
LSAGKSVHQLAFSPDGRVLAAGIEDGTAKLWETSSWRPSHTLGPYPAADVHSLAFSPDGRTIALGFGTFTISLWDVATGQLLRTIEGKDNGFAAFLPNGMLVTVGGDHAQLWDALSGRPLQSFEPYFLLLILSPEGGLAASYTAGGLAFWEPASRSPEMSFRPSNEKAPETNRSDFSIMFQSMLYPTSAYSRPLPPPAIYR